MSKSLTKKEIGTWGMAAHLSALVGILGFGWDVLFCGIVLGPLFIWLTKGKLNSIVNINAKEALNFQITILIAAFVLAILSAVLPFLQILVVLVLLVGFGFAIYGGLQVKGGKNYTYPFALRLIK